MSSRLFDRRRLNGSIAALALLLNTASAATQPRRDAPDESTLNPGRPHIEILLDPLYDRVDTLRLAFYESPRLTGAPVMELTAAGLFLRGKLACTWPGGRLDASPAREHLMILGYADADATDYRGCPPGLPIRSIKAYADGVYPQLLIEVVALRGTLAETRSGRARWYFDLNALPGDPVDWGTRIQTRFRRLVRLKGFSAWAWQESTRDIERRAAALEAALLQDGTFTTFLRGIRACLSSSSVPGCLVPFVASSPSAVVDVENLSGDVTADQFVDFMWRQPTGTSAPNAMRPWDDLVQCLSSGTPDWIHSTMNAVRFEIADFSCDVQRFKDGWKLAEFMAAP